MVKGNACVRVSIKKKEMEMGEERISKRGMRKNKEKKKKKTKIDLKNIKVKAFDSRLLTLSLPGYNKGDEFITAINLTYSSVS